MDSVDLVQARNCQVRLTHALQNYVRPFQLVRLTEVYMAAVLPLAEYKRRRRNVEQRLEASG